MKVYQLLVFTVLSTLFLCIKGNSAPLLETAYQYKNNSSLPDVEKQALQDTLNRFEESINSNQDEKKEKVWGPNEEKAWLDYRLFEENLRTGSEINDYLAETKAYIKDSTEVLIVKLKGLEMLDQKGLFVKDIIRNEDYYLALLDEFEHSDLPPKTYLYFENKIRKITLEEVNKKYQRSLLLNFIGLITIGGLTFGYIKTKQAKPSSNVLSKQEKRVKDLIREGKTNKEIAAELFISVSTVKTHTSNIYSKLGVKNRKELQANT